MTNISLFRRTLARSFAANPLLQAVVIVLFAVSLAFPYLVDGVSAGYDARTHVQYQHHFSDQFWSGEVYPRWLAGANKGYGSPTFLIQYPLPYFVTSLLRPVLLLPNSSDREARELGAFCFLALTSAGLAFWYWTRQFANASAATLASLVYLSLPYLLTCLYVRAAIGELSALIFMPLSLGFCESMHRKSGILFLVSASLALLFVSNLLLAVLFTPALCVYGLFSGRQAGIPLSQTVGRLTLSIILSLGIASAYLVPVVIYGQLFDPGGMAANLQDFEVGHYFLYLTSGSLDSRRMLLVTAGAVGLLVASGCAIWYRRSQRFVAATMATIVAFGALTMVPNLGLALVRLSGFSVSKSTLWELFSSRLALTSISTMALGVLASAWLRERGGARELGLLWIAGVAFALMLPFSAPVWKAIPFLQMLQFPFRFGGVVMVAVAGLIAVAFDSLMGRRDRKSRLMLWLFGLAVNYVILAGIATFRIDERFRRFNGPVKYEVARNIDVNYRMYVPPAHLNAFAEAMGSRPDSYSAVPTSGDGSLRLSVAGGENCVRLVRDGPRMLSVEADCQGPVNVQIGQLRFPLWRRVQAAGEPEGAALGTSRSGLMELRLAPGKQKVRVEFVYTWAERWGLMASAASLLASVIGYVLFSWRSRPGAVQAMS